MNVLRNRYAADLAEKAGPGNIGFSPHTWSDDLARKEARIDHYNRAIPVTAILGVVLLAGGVALVTAAIVRRRQAAARGAPRVATAF